MKRNRLKMLAAALLLAAAGSQVAKAVTIDAPTLSRLSNVRDTLKVNGCDKFIVVQAFMDGLITQDVPYELYYTPGKVMLNKVTLDEPYQTSYGNMLREFFAVDNKMVHGAVNSFKISSTGGDLSAEHFLAIPNNPADCHCNQEEIPAASTKTTTIKSRIGVQPAGSIIYSKDGITVNGRKLSASEEQEYKSLYFNQFAAPEGKETINRSSGKK